MLPWEADGAGTPPSQHRFHPKPPARGWVNNGAPLNALHMAAATVAAPGAIYQSTPPKHQRGSGQEERAGVSTSGAPRPPASLRKSHLPSCWDTAPGGRAAPAAGKSPSAPRAGSGIWKTLRFPLKMLGSSLRALALCRFGLSFSNEVCLLLLSGNIFHC